MKNKENVKEIMLWREKRKKNGGGGHEKEKKNGRIWRESKKRNIVKSKELPKV